MKESALVRFYRGDEPDDCGRRLDAILAWSDRDLEGVHDYIQWLFPLDEPSAFNIGAPLVSAADREAFGRDPFLTANLRRAFDRMLVFYGLTSIETSGHISVTRGANWGDRSRVWLRSGNHNFLRLTRIMKSLVLLGQPALAAALFDALAAEYLYAADVIGARTLGFWKAAVDR